MKNRRSSPVVRLSLSVLAALLLILSFPPFNIWIFAWMAFIPLLFAIEGQKPLRAFLLSYLTGYLFFIGTIYWLIHVTLPGMFAIAAYLAIYFGLFGVIVSYSQLPTPNYKLFFIPAAWVALEWIRAHALTGFGWNLLGYSQSFNLPVIQISDISGVYGVSFLVVMFNTAVYLTIKNLRKKKDVGIPLIIVSFFIFLVLGYGYFRLNNIFTGEKIRIAVIQGNIPQNEKWDPDFSDMIMAKYLKLTKEAAKGKCDLIVWPETSVPGFIENEKDMLDKVKYLVSDVNTPVLVGAPRYEDTKKGTLYYNSAYLFSKDGRIAGRYDKVHLVPFGEYVPLKNVFAFVERFSRRPIGDFTAGKDYTVFRFFLGRSANDKDARWQFMKKVSFSCLICFEDIFSPLAREFVKRKANFLINMTNDAWFGRSGASYQHAQASIFRAVENRINMIRAANTGLSCFIDQKGRVTARVSDGKNDQFVDGFSVHDIVLSRTKTIYSVYGDVFAYICLLFTILTILRIIRFYKAGI